ncbi:unnamed protein product [Protopolystoma xenopodis]|uniref:Kinesin motor domain-containing protein n=1 Tax=Protopolystoma xenopodis TaxID=117903 RepID=A0A3S5CLP9_9PLAT|nr:unnamed protein product [Protopolystoma xenopodis]
MGSGRQSRDTISTHTTGSTAGAISPDPAVATAPTSSANACLTPDCVSVGASSECLGSSSKANRSNNALSFSSLATVLLALVNGQRHIPHRDSRLAQLLRGVMGSLKCRTCFVIHVSPSPTHYNESLQVASP